MTDDDADRIFAALAERLMPEAEGMPVASKAADLKSGLKSFLNSRPDTRGDIMQGLRWLGEKERDDAGLNEFAREHPAAWAALSLAILSIYYNSPLVQKITGYAGPKRHDFDADAVPDYIAEGLLQPVIARGAIWRKV